MYIVCDHYSVNNLVGVYRMCNVAEHAHNTQHTTNTNYNKHNFCDVPRSVKIKHHPLSVRGDQGSSVVIHGQSVAIRYHPMSVREDQSSCRSVKINK